MTRLRSDKLLVEYELAESTSLSNQTSASSRSNIVTPEPCTKCEIDRKECRQPLPEQNVKICERCQTLETECSFASPSVPKPDSPHGPPRIRRHMPSATAKRDAATSTTAAAHPSPIHSTDITPTSTSAAAADQIAATAKPRRKSTQSKRVKVTGAASSLHNAPLPECDSEPSPPAKRQKRRKPNKAPTIPVESSTVPIPHLIPQPAVPLPDTHISPASSIAYDEPTSSSSDAALPVADIHPDLGLNAIFYQLAKLEYTTYRLVALHDVPLPPQIFEQAKYNIEVHSRINQQLLNMMGSGGD